MTNNTIPNTQEGNPRRRKPVPPEEWDTVEDPLAEAIKLGETILSLSTGHDEYQRRKIACYAVATHYVERFEQFPGLVIHGNPATGKTMTLNFLKGTCYRVAELTAATASEAAFKFCMNEANSGTLIIEEADKMTARDLEELLTTRARKDSASWKKAVREEGEWVVKEFRTFGASVVHKRISFASSALMRRMIVVSTMRRQKDYIQIRRRSKLFQIFKDKLVNLPELPAVRNIWGIEPGVFDCYKPLVALAQYLDDLPFISRLVKEMKEASQELRIEEAHLEPQTLLRALIALTYEKYGGGIASRRINFDVSRIMPTVIKIAGPDSPAVELKANQRNRILRKDFGFTIENFGGAYRVCFIQAQLVKKCDEYGVEDKILEVWRAQVES